jgi:Predicted deacylase
VEAGVDGVFNVLEYYGLLPGRVRARTQTRSTGFDQYGAPTGGLVDFEADLGQRVSVGETLYTVTDAFGAAEATVTADSDGILWRTRRLPQVASGEYVCSVGVDIDTY